MVKALAQYKLALRLDPANKDARSKIELLHSNKTITELKLEPIEDGAREPTRSVIPLFSDFTQEEFNEFTKRMIIHTLPPGKSYHQRRGHRKVGLYPYPRFRKGLFPPSGVKRWNLPISMPVISSARSRFSRASHGPQPLKQLRNRDVLEVAEDALNEMISKSPRIREVLHNYHEQRVKSTIEKVKDAM